MHESKKPASNATRYQVLYKLNTFVVLQGGFTGINQKIDTCFLLLEHS